MLIRIALNFLICFAVFVLILNFNPIGFIIGWSFGILFSEIILMNRRLNKIEEDRLL